MMNNKKLSAKILSVLGFLSLVFVALVAYLYINDQAKKQLPELKKTTDSQFKVKPEPTMEPGKAYPKSKPRTAVFLNYPLAEKNSLLSINTAKNLVKIGESFSLDINLNAPGEVVDGAEFVLSFDPRLVMVETIAEGTFFSLYPQKDISAQEGKVRIIALQGPDENKVLNQEKVVSIHMKALQKGVLSFSFDTAKTHVAAYAGQEILKQAAPITVTVQ